MSLLLPEKLNKPFQAILFDLDGTLFDSEELHYQAFEEAMKEAGHEFRELAQEIVFQGSFKDLFKEVAKRLKITDEQMALIYQRKLELTISSSFADVDLIDGILSFLEFLKEQSVPMGVVTNADREYVDHILNEHNVTKYFQQTVSTSEIDNPKPDPEGYLKAAELMNIEPANILVFENSDIGIMAAKAANMNVIAIRDTDVLGVSNYEAADHIIDSFADDSINELSFK